MILFSMYSWVSGLFRPTQIKVKAEGLTKVSDDMDADEVVDEIIAQTACEDFNKFLKKRKWYSAYRAIKSLPDNYRNYMLVGLIASCLDVYEWHTAKRLVIFLQPKVQKNVLREIDKIRAETEYRQRL